MSDTPTPPHGWRLVDKANDVRTENTPVAIWHSIDDDGLWLCCDGGDKWYDEFYAVPFDWPPKPPTINDVPWITDRRPTEQDSLEHHVVALSSKGRPTTLHRSYIKSGEPWKPLGPCDPPPKREPKEWWLVVFKDGSFLSYDSECRADDVVDKYIGSRKIKVREVMEDDQ